MRAYCRIGIETAESVLVKGKNHFTLDSFHFLGSSLDPKVQRSYIGEFLSAWEDPSNAPGHSTFAYELRQALPRLHVKVATYWKGY